MQAEVRDAGRASQWRTSWRLALRMARRDVRRNKGRTALAFAMIFLPTMLLAATVVLVATSDVSGARSVPYRLGDATATLNYQGYKAGVAQDPDPGADMTAWPQGATTGGDPHDSASPPTLEQQRSAIESATGGKAVPFLDVAMRYPVGGITRRDSAWLYDPSTLTGRATLVSGRWPSGPGEAVVTEYGLTRGLPRSGPVPATLDTFGGGPQSGSEEPTKRTLTVVGVATPTANILTGASIPALIAQPDTSDLSAGFATQGSLGGWYVVGGAPVTWSKVKELNTAGFVVASAQVLANPPGKAELYPPNPFASRGNAVTQRTLTLFGYAFMAVVTALLVAPAFAVSAARSRRTLALAASNGARTADLRRTVLAQALVIGIAATAASAAFGVAAVSVAGPITRWRSGYDVMPGVSVPWTSLAAMVLIGLLSVIVAALIPANRLGRLDIVSVMRGQVTSPRPSLMVFGVGVAVTLASALALLGATVTLRSAAVGTGEGTGVRQAVAAITGLTLIGGAVFLVPMALAGLAKVGGRLPTSGSMAARDLGRHRGRSAPAVSAVLAAAAALTFGLVVLQADVARQARGYVPQALPGEGALLYDGPPTGGKDARQTVDRIRAAHPELVFTEPKTFFSSVLNESSGEATMPWLRIIPEGCTPADADTNPTYEAALKEFETKYPKGPPRNVAPPVNRCSFDQLHPQSHIFGGGTSLLVMPADWLIKRLNLNEQQAKALREGGIVYATRDTSGLPSGDVSLAHGTTSPVEAGSKVAVERTWSAPFIAVPDTSRTAGALLSQSRAIASDGPSATGLELQAGTPGGLIDVVTTADGSPLTNTQVASVRDAVGDIGIFEVETGHPYDPTEIIRRIVLGIFTFLALLVVLTTTALSLAEQQRDQSTLAAVGATRGTRRVMAGVQALLTASAGAMAGVLVGLIPGLCMAYAILGTPPRSEAGTAGVVESTTAALPSFVPMATTDAVPWLSLGVMAVGIPLVAGLVAALGIRRAPTVVRRTS